MVFAKNALRLRQEIKQKANFFDKSCKQLMQCYIITFDVE